MNQPTPYYDDGQAVIYHGDCRKILPAIDLSGVDLLLTDPPYGISLNTDNSRFSGRKGNISGDGNGKGSVDGAPIANDDKPFDPSFLLSFGQHQIVWGWNHFPSSLPRGTCLVWIKRFDESFGLFLSDAEVAWMSKGHGVYCRRDLSNNAIANERVHPTQKPVSLMRWCIDFFPNSRTVLDPYMGSGTTLRAAKDMGRRSIGIELDERYCEVAAQRLMQEALWGAA